MRGQCSVVSCSVVGWLLACCCGCARAAMYYVTVAGLGGEPDYEQRFTANAKDLDKIFKASAGRACVYADGEAGYEGEVDGGAGGRSRAMRRRRTTLC